MVKGRRASSSTSDQRPRLPLASLSVPSTLLKPARRPSALVSLPQRPPLVHINSPAMNYPPSPCSSAPTRSLYGVETHAWKKESDTKGVAKSMTRSNRLDHSVEESTVYPIPSVEDEEVLAERPEHAITCGRQRLQQHRIQMSGKVIIPETWGREQQLQEWVNYGIVEDALRPAGLMSARTALLKDCQHRGAKKVRISPCVAMSPDVEVS